MRLLALYIAFTSAFHRYGICTILFTTADLAFCQEIIFKMKCNAEAATSRY